jgi:hypothetical protein
MNNNKILMLLYLLIEIGAKVVLEGIKELFLISVI